MLSVYDGITVLRRIRKVSDIPIIMLTARNQASDISNALDQGFRWLYDQAFWNRITTLMIKMKKSSFNLYLLLVFSSSFFRKLNI